MRRVSTRAGMLPASITDGCAAGRRMTLGALFEHQGSWLFRYRSHLPLLLAPLFAVAVVHARTVPSGPVLGTAWEACCVALAFIGVAVRAGVIGYAPAKTSGRNTRVQVAEVLNTAGMYSVVRHPLYLGNAFGFAAIALYTGSVWLAAIVLLAFALYYERIMLAEEAYLRERFGSAFESWAARVPAIVPNPRLWHAPPLAFSWRTVIRREYHGVVAVLATFAALRWVRTIALRRGFVVDPVALGYAAVGGLVFVVCRYFAKRTQLLRVRGR
jgi:protein-S-isoprenylcysteine O-methyltransferase Ste14